MRTLSNKIGQLLVLSTLGTLAALSMGQDCSDPAYTIQLRIIALADDDGSRGTTVTTQQLRDHIATANNVFASVNISFTWDESRDYKQINDTTLNSMINSGGGFWTAPNAEAAKSPGKLVIFLRHGGSGPSPATNAFAYPPNIGYPAPPLANYPTDNVDYVAFYNKTEFAFPFNAGTFAHELGHYLGLHHTFPGWGAPSVAQVVNQVQTQGASGVDGDGLSDTPPDPGNLYFRSVVSSDGSDCAPPAAYTIFNIPFAPDRSNIMSYYGCANPDWTLTTAQNDRMRETLATSFRNHLIEPVCPTEFTDLPSSEYQRCFNYWAGQDMWPVTVSATQEGSEIKMAASFQDVPSSASNHLLTESTYTTLKAQREIDGLRPGKLHVLPSSSGLRISVIWTTVDAPFQSNHRMTLAEFIGIDVSLSFVGYIIEDFHAYEDNGLRIAATWVNRPGAAFNTVTLSQTTSQYQAEFDQNWPLGIRPIRFSSYPTSQGTLHAALWKSVPTPWAHYFLMSDSDFATRHANFSGQGLKLLDLKRHNGTISAIWSN